MVPQMSPTIAMAITIEHPLCPWTPYCHPRWCPWSWSLKMTPFCGQMTSLYGHWSKITPLHVHVHLIWHAPPHVHGHSKWPPTMSMVIPGNIVTQNIVLLYPWSAMMTPMVISDDSTVSHSYCHWVLKMTPIHVHGHPTWPYSMSMVNQNDPLVCPCSTQMTPTMSMVTPDYPPVCPWSLKMTSLYVIGCSRWLPTMYMVTQEVIVWDGSSN